MILAFVLIAGMALCQTQPEPYKLGPEDVVTLTVLRHPELSGDLLVPADGTIDLPFAGPTKVSGLTLVQLRELIVKALEKRIYNAEAIVTLKIPGSRRVYAEGSVKLSAALDYKPGWRISEVLAASGGLVDSAQPIDTTVTVLRAATSKSEEVSLSDALSGSPKANLFVYPGDVVTFTAVQTISVYVVGQVSKPGVYPMRVDHTGVMAAISLAGGFIPTASTGGVTVTHLNGEVERLDLSRIVLYGEKGTNLPNLKSGDLVTVPELQSRFAITGMVKNPGIFPIADGKILRLSDAISLSGGEDTKRSRLSRVAVLRSDNGKMKRMVIDFGRFLSKGDGSQDIVLRPGDVIFVPETNSIDWNQIFNGLISTYYILNSAINLKNSGV